jgi:uncharacterized protein (TIGR02266 family)
MANMPAVFREYKRLDQQRGTSGLSVEELERWTQLKRLLTSHFTPAAGPKIAAKRASLRVPTRLRVNFDSVDGLRECLMTNISRGGVFVATDNPLEVGSTIRLRLDIQETGKTLEFEGSVAVVNAGADMCSDDRGMGIRFGQLSEQQEALIQELYGKALDKQGDKPS